jgi:hypothetical protein
LACRLADGSWLPRRATGQQLPNAHSIAVARGRNTQSRSSPHAVRHVNQPALPTNKVHGIGA